jgi:hypothetical protein
MSHIHEVNAKLEAVDAECKRFLHEFSDHVLPDTASASLKKIVEKTLEMWKVYHSECEHDPKPFAIPDQSRPDRPMVWISPEGDWVVMAMDLNKGETHPKPTKVSLSQLSEMNYKPAELVRAIRRQLHFLAVQTMTTQPAGRA